MKKILTVIFMLLMGLFLVTSCFEETTPNNPNDTNNPPVDTNPDDNKPNEEETNKGIYTFEFSEKVFAGNETKELNEVEWTLDGTYDDEIGYWGYNGTKGQQFGSAVYTYREMTLKTTEFDKVSKVVVYASGSNKTKTTLTVTVGEKQLGETIELTNTNAKYVFSSDELLSGEVVLTYLQAKEDSSVAIYMKSIKVVYGYVEEGIEESDKPVEEEIKHDVNTYSYTFENKVFKENGTQSLNDVSWTLSGDGAYWGYTETKGEQFGSSNAPYTNMSLLSDLFKNIKKITINTSGAKDTTALLNVYVGDKLVGENISLTADATEYSLSLDKITSGNVKFEYTQSTSKAIYIKSIVVETVSGLATTEQEIHNLLELGLDYITLANDIEVDTFVVVGHKFTLDLDGHKISAIHDLDNDHSTYGLYAKGGAEVTVTGNGTIYGGTNGWWNIALRASGDGSVINVLNGSFYSGPNEGEEDNGNSTMFVNGSSTINIYGGLFYTEASYDGIYFVFNVAQENHATATINVYGGTFVNANPKDGQHIAIVGRPFLAEGLTIKTEIVDGNKHYTVVEE